MLTLMNTRLHTVESQLNALWLKAKAGDAISYSLLLHELSRHLRSFLKRRLQSRVHEVEDLVQEVLLAIHQKRHTYQADQPLTSWVYAIARYKLIDHLRSYARRESQHDDIEDWQDELWGYDPSAARDSKGMLQSMLSELPDKQRLPIELTKLEGHSLEESARITGQSLASVKVNIHRGLKDLKELAKKLGGNP